MDLRKLLEDVKCGTINIEDALDSLKNLPYEDIGYANIDHHRQIRNGYPEVIYCEGKSDEHTIHFYFHIRSLCVNGCRKPLTNKLL